MRDPSLRNIVTVNPFRCRMWDLHDRLEQHVTDSTCRSEIDSFSQHGQLVPVLGRPLQGDPDHDVELIYGARRLFVARHINKALLVELRDLSDREAMVAMHIENLHRLDVSPYERALSYARCLRSGRFGSQEDLARALKVSASQVSRLLKLARLPSVVVAAFETPVDICESWGLELVDALDDPARRARTVQRARDISSSTLRPAAADVYAQLMGVAVQRRKPGLRPRDEIIRSADGQALFRIRQQRNSVSLVLPMRNVPPLSIKRIRDAVTLILSDGSADADRTKLQVA